MHWVHHKHIAFKEEKIQVVAYTVELVSKISLSLFPDRL